MNKIWAKADIKRSFFARRGKKGLAEGRSTPQELEEGPRSGPHLLVVLKIETPNGFKICPKLQCFNKQHGFSIFYENGSYWVLGC